MQQLPAMPSEYVSAKQAEYDFEPAAPNQPRRWKSTGQTITDMQRSIIENGRSYYGLTAGEYSLPNDGEEQGRLDFNHKIYSLVLDGDLAKAPIRAPRHVLDIGTGTGIWAINFAKNNPMSFVIGTDLNDIQPTNIPSNCQFYTENSETQTWEFDHAFDYIHLRGVGPCFSDVRTVLRKSFDHMNPGGWIELQDWSWEIFYHEGSAHSMALNEWVRQLIIGAANTGRDLTKMKHYKEYLNQTGFVDVQEKPFLVPGGPWLRGAKNQEIGTYLLNGFYMAVDSFRKILGLAGLSTAEIDNLTARVKFDLQNPRIRWYIMAYVVYGRKPFTYEAVPLESNQRLPWPKEEESERKYWPSPSHTRDRNDFNGPYQASGFNPDQPGGRGNQY